MIQYENLRGAAFHGRASFALVASPAHIAVYQELKKCPQGQSACVAENVFKIVNPPLRWPTVFFGRGVPPAFYLACHACTRSLYARFKGESLTYFC